MNQTLNTEPFRTDKDRLRVSLMSPRERQHLVKTAMYPYPGFKAVQEFISRFHYPVAGGAADTGNIGGILGQSRTGKSVICRYYADRIPPRVEEDGEVYPVVYIPAASEMTPGTLAERIFFETGARSVPTIKIAALMQNAMVRLKRAGTELVIIDDAQFLFFDRHKRHVAEFQSFIKQLADLNSLNVLLVGEERLRDFVRNIDYLVGRGGFPSESVVPMASDEQGMEHFRLLLDGIDRRMPFAAPSRLGRADWMFDFYRYSDGIIGRVMNLVRRAAYRAISEGTTSIMRKHLHEEAWAELPAGATNDFFLTE
ncbi:MAG: TniB family NTP-binding protein [Hydrogenophaga sp.]|nr:TniB family NTP-binding protein [Hydrogenophaga sp.]